jgi:hypothetical protein
MSPEDTEPRRYFSSRKGKEPISAAVAQWRLANLYVVFRDKDYFNRSWALSEITPLITLKDWQSCVLVSVRFQ